MNILYLTDSFRDYLADQIHYGVCKLRRPECVIDYRYKPLIMRWRPAGFDACLLPHPEELPMANGREDILIKKTVRANQWIKQIN